MSRSALVVPALACFFASSIASFAACSTVGPATGKAQITTTIPGVTLTSNEAVSIAREELPTTQLKVGLDNVACDSSLDANRITIDIHSVHVGTFTVREGYPSLDKLVAGEARAHVCPPQPAGTTNPAPCHEQVRTGTVTVTRYDRAVGGTIEGTFQITFADGDVTGSFSALRCQ